MTVAPKQGKPAKTLPETLQEIGPFMTWGWQFALTLGVLAWGGHWLDQKLGTNVLFVLIGLFMGLFGGFFNLFRTVARLPKSKGKETKP